MRKFLVGLVALTAMTTGLVLAADVGPKMDVAAVRDALTQKFPNEHVAGAHVVGNYALLDWYDQHSSGYGTYKRVSGERWKQIDWGGGATNVSLLVQHGVPAAVARQLCSGWGSASPC